MNYANRVEKKFGQITSIIDEMDRDNNTWLTHLASQGKEQVSALDSLRTALLRNLQRAISTRKNVDESFIEDAVQDSLILILDKLDQFEGRSQFLTWATSIAIRVSMTKLRRNHWKDISLEQVITDSDFIFDESTDHESTPEIEWQRNAILNKLYSAIQTELTEKQKTALLSELKGIPQDEIAKHLGSSRNAIYKLTHDARKSLKKSLETEGFSAADINMSFVA